MAFSETPVSQGDLVFKNDYDRLMDNTKENRLMVRGYNSSALSNINNNSEPKIIGRVEINGEIVNLASLISITGWSGIANSSNVYVKVTGLGAASFTITTPTWDNTKQGWYSGSDRYVFKIYKDASGLYTNKASMSQERIIDTENIRDKAITSDKLNGGVVLLPLGTILMFNGVGWVNDSTIQGWYKCDGNNGTPNLINKFIRSEASSGNTDGSDNAIVVTHDHGGTSGNTSPGTGNQSSNHKHSYLDYSNHADRGRGQKRVADDVPNTALTGNNNVPHSHIVNAHGHSISSTGSSGAGANKPAYYSLIFVIRMI